MSRRRSRHEPPPPCYAMVFPGLESVAEDELKQDFGAEVKRSAPGMVVFRVPEIDTGLLHLRTTEDVFLLAWGTDQLSYRAVDLQKIQRWTAYEADWERLLRIHHAIRPKPKGRPTYRLVTQMTGEHGYRRKDARDALARGLEGKLPHSWRPAEDNASVEIWLTINGATAVCGMRLSDRKMRHRKYKTEHLRASLRPTIAASMVRLAEIKSRHTVLDPMCGAGTIVAEALEWAKQAGIRIASVWAGDMERGALRSAEANMRHLSKVHYQRWDARQLPLPDQCIDRIICNPPFGIQLGSPEEIRPLYRALLREWNRVLQPRGKAVLLVSDQAALRVAADAVGWKSERQLRVRVLGQMATMSVWQKVRDE